MFGVPSVVTVTRGSTTETTTHRSGFLNLENRCQTLFTRSTRMGGLRALPPSLPREGKSLDKLPQEIVKSFRFVDGKVPAGSCETL